LNNPTIGSDVICETCERISWVSPAPEGDWYCPACKRKAELERAVADGYFARKEERELTLFCPKRPRGISGVRVVWRLKARRDLRPHDPLASERSFSVSWVIDPRQMSTFSLDIVLALAERGIPSSCPRCGAEGKAVAHQRNGCPSSPKAPRLCPTCGEPISASGYCKCPLESEFEPTGFCPCGASTFQGEEFYSDCCESRFEE